jgi:hypothetical protein
MQWHALAFLLGELCHHTTGDLVARAWISVEKCVEAGWKQPTLKDGSRSSHLWKPLMKLLAKARMARLQAIRKDQAIKQATPPGTSPDLPKQRITSAPLSAAQLSRFMRPAAYGTQPLDSTELMNSPKGPEATIFGDDPMDISLLAPEVGVNQSTITMNTSATNPPQAFGSLNGSSMSSAVPGPFNNFHTTSQQATSNNTNTNTNANANANAVVTATPPGFSPFDSTGDIDWQTWDQLVRQFGLEDNAAVLDPTTNQPANWAGTWSNSNMSGGGWF